MPLLSPNPEIPELFKLFGFGVWPQKTGQKTKCANKGMKSRFDRDVWVVFSSKHMEFRNFANADRFVMLDVQNNFYFVILMDLVLV